MTAHTHPPTDHEILTEFKTAQWPRAYRTQDVELLGRLLHSRFELIDDQGNRTNRADELAWVAENEWDPGEFEYRIERLEIFGDMAIIAGFGDATEYSYRSSNVLVKENGEWSAVASHVSGLETKAVESSR